MGETEKETFTPAGGDGTNAHRVIVEFDDGCRMVKLVHPDHGCQPGNCECGRNLSMSLAEWQEENYTEEEVAEHNAKTTAPLEGIGGPPDPTPPWRPLGTCYDCSEITSPQTGVCWVQSWYENLMADEMLSGQIELDVSPSFDDDTLVLEILRARVPGESTR